MNLINHPNARSAFAAVALLAAFGPFPAKAQETAVDGTEAQARSIMSDPRLKNMLRTVKEESTEALTQLEEDPDAAVDRATRLFQESKNKVDPEKLKAAAAKLQDEGVVDEAVTAVSSVMPGASKPVADQRMPTAAPADNVPATRPAPGISGGVPTPLAMPLTPGEIPPVEAPAVAKGSAPATDTVVQSGSVAAIPGAAPTSPMIPDSPGLKPDSIPEPTPLKKKYEPVSGGGFNSGGGDRMEILSKESIMDNAKGILLFTGNVLVTHPEFEIKCDKIEILLADGVGMDSAKSKSKESGPPIKRATASGGMVEIKRTTVEEGVKKTQIAIARSLNYNAATRDITLSGGPPYIQDGDRFIKTNSEDAQIIMRGNGKYEITGTSNRSQIVIPVPKSEGDKGKSGLGGGIGDALGGGF